MIICWYLVEEWVQWTGEASNIFHGRLLFNRIKQLINHHLHRWNLIKKTSSKKEKSSNPSLPECVDYSENWTHVQPNPDQKPSSISRSWCCPCRTRAWWPSWPPRRTCSSSSPPSAQTRPLALASSQSNVWWSLGGLRRRRCWSEHHLGGVSLSVEHHPWRIKR